SVSALPLMVTAPAPVPQTPPTLAVAASDGCKAYEAAAKPATSEPLGTVPPQFDAVLQVGPVALLFQVKTAARSGEPIRLIAARNGNSASGSVRTGRRNGAAH